MARWSKEHTLLRVERKVLKKTDPNFEMLREICNHPNYTNKSGQKVFQLTRHDCVLKGNILSFPDYFKGYTIQVEFTKVPRFMGFNYVCMYTSRRNVVIELMYCVAKPRRLPDNGRYLGVNIGVNDLATVFSNTQLAPFVINGKALNEVNEQYNRKYNYYQELCKKANNQESSARLERMTMKRDDFIENYMHKTSRYIVNCCLENDINTIVIGDNVESEPTSRAKLIEMLRYKAEQKGISVIMAEDAGDKSEIRVFTKVFTGVTEGAGLHPVVIDVV